MAINPNQNYPSQPTTPQLAGDTKFAQFTQTVTPVAVQIMSAVEAAKFISAASQIIFTNAVGYGTYRMEVGGVNFYFTIRHQGMGDICITVTETTKGNMSTKVVPSEEAYRKSPQEWLQQYLPMMMNEIAVFLKLEYVGP